MGPPSLRRLAASAFLLVHIAWLPPAAAQVVISGRILHERSPGSTEQMHFGAVLCFANLVGPGSEARSFRSWEAAPSGWYRLSGPAGNYTLLFSDPAQFARPVILTNVFTCVDDRIDRSITPRFDHACFHEGAWDERPAAGYDQIFTAAGESVTHVGFKLATDGVDGFGPGSQNLLVSIHRRGEGAPDTWEQVGPAMPVLGVDCGGAKNLSWSAGWNSGEVPTIPGEVYAVRMRAENPSGTFQAFWRPGGGGCHRVGPTGETGFQDRSLWMAVAGDSDGLLIPYRKRVHKRFHGFAGFRRKWSQTYVAQGKSLASVVLYAAVGGTQPSINRQRVAVRLRRGGPGGPTVGIEKIAVGNGLYTGDASWGTFGAACAPGEVPLVPGETYAVEFESIENYETLHGFVNIKGESSDERPGFNPYRKCPPDTYERGSAYAGGTDPVDLDLDLEIVEYRFAAENWDDAVEPENLLANGNMERGRLVPGKPADGGPEAWKAFSVDPGTVHHYVTEGPEGKDRIVRAIGGGFNGKTVDGGYVQRVAGLSRLETYRLSGRIRSSWAVDDRHRCDVGYDPTGQDTNAEASTIVWTPLPAVHGVFVPYRSSPIRPAKDAVSVWLRARTTLTADMPFKADFDDFALQQVRTGVPGPL